MVRQSTEALPTTPTPPNATTCRASIYIVIRSNNHNFPKNTLYNTYCSSLFFLGKEGRIPRPRKIFLKKQQLVLTSVKRSNMLKSENNSVLGIHTV